MTEKAVFLGLIFMLLVITCYAPPVNKKAKEEKKAEEDLPEYARYLKQVVQILEQDDEYVQKLMNASDEDLKSGKIAEDIDLVKHDVRTKLDELKRQEIERQRMIRRQMNDHNKGLKEREHWNPIFDDDNPDFFGPEDFKKLLDKHHTEMEKRDEERKKDFKKHEMEKEHERRAKLHTMDEEHRKQEEKKHEEAMKKMHDKNKDLHHPGSKAQLEKVWEETDGLDKNDFDPKTFFKLHDVNGDNYLDTSELEALFVREVGRLHDPKDENFDPKERDEEMSRMREHVMTEIDKDKDGFISREEFMTASKGEEFEKDEGWKGIDEERPYTDDELADFEKNLKDEEHARDAQKDGVETKETDQHDEQKKQEHHEEPQKEQHHDEPQKEHLQQH